MVKQLSKRSFDVRFNPKLRKYVTEALQNTRIRDLLAYYHLNETEQGIARLALILFLRDNAIGPEDHPRRHNDSTS